MLTGKHLKLPMRDKTITKDFYTNQLGSRKVGTAEFDGYLILEKDHIQIHFFEFKELDPQTKMGRYIYEPMV